MTLTLEQAIKDEARRLGFLLAGVTTPDPPLHLSAFENWLMQGRHATMNYLADDRARARRADPRLILPECKSILMLALPYSDPSPLPQGEGQGGEGIWARCSLCLGRGLSSRSPKTLTGAG